MNSILSTFSFVFPTLSLLTWCLSDSGFCSHYIATSVPTHHQHSPDVVITSCPTVQLETQLLQNPVLHPSDHYVAHEILRSHHNARCPARLHCSSVLANRRVRGRHRPRGILQGNGWRLDTTFYTETADGSVDASITSDKFFSNSTADAFVSAMAKVAVMSNDQASLVDCLDIISGAFA
ncbi:Uu.00g052350.m01.CDS01 [Anthostomella pinea]|uniref:Uu.00g052350.m01.CDS01 n=1 Tax=Anthostomella pinea TaxID=933095 RepID=A0AAI8VWV1_9PEZI|nr:Uu.00g052350.m01.CDS01 [Anthostomella pinea]